MKVLLDENLPHELRTELKGHEVFTTRYMGWDGTKNGALLAKAAADGFDAMVTMDNGVRYQQNLKTLPVSVVILSAPSNDMDDLRPLVPEMLETFRTLPPRTVVRIPSKRNDEHS